MSLHGSKNVTLAGTAVPLVAATVGTPSQPLTLRYVSRLQIQSKPANTGNIYVGWGAASSTSYGVLLAPGESAPFGPQDGRSNDTDLSQVYIDADVNGNGVTYSGEQW